MGRPKKTATPDEVLSQVNGETPATPAPPEPKEADGAKASPAPAAPPASVSDTFAVFDAPPSDPVRKRDGATVGPDGEVKTRKPRVKKKDAEAQAYEERLPQAQKEAEGAVRSVGLLATLLVRKRYASVLTEKSLEQLTSEMALTDDEVAAVAQPLAEGFAQSGVSMPWQARLAFAGLAVALPRVAMVVSVEKAMKANAKTLAAA